MKVSFSPSMSAVKSRAVRSYGSLPALYDENAQYKELKNKELHTKIKRVVSELSVVAFGVCLVYFGMKCSFKNADISAEARKNDRLRRLIPPLNVLPKK